MKHATISDFDEIKSIFKKHKEWVPHIRHDKLKRQIESGECAFDEGVVITYNLYKRNTSLGDVVASKGDCILHQIVTAQQGNGSASRVFKKFVDYIDATIFLSVRAENLIAVGFYKKMGMDVVGKTSWKNGEIEGLIFRMERKATPNPVVISSEELINEFASKITNRWRDAVSSILETATLLKQAKASLGNDREWNILVSKLPFTRPTAVKLLQIASNDYLPKVSNQLPPYWTTIYELSSKSKEELDEGIDSRVVHPEADLKSIVDFYSSKSVRTTTLRKDKQSNDKSLGTIFVPNDFDVSQLDNLQKDIEKLQKKYGLTLTPNDTKTGFLGLHKEKRFRELVSWLYEREKTYNRCGLSEEGLEVFRDAFAQRKQNVRRYVKVGEEEHPNSIYNEKHPYHGWTNKQFYDYARENLIITQYTDRKSLDKESHIVQLLVSFINPKSNAMDRSSSKKKLLLLQKKGDPSLRPKVDEALKEIEYLESLK